MFFGAMQTPGRAKLILIKGQGMDGMTYYLQSNEHIAGRSEGPIPKKEREKLALFCNVHPDRVIQARDVEVLAGWDDPLYGEVQQHSLGVAG